MKIADKKIEFCCDTMENVFVDYGIFRFRHDEDGFMELEIKQCHRSLSAPPMLFPAVVRFCLFCGAKVEKIK